MMEMVYLGDDRQCLTKNCYKNSSMDAPVVDKTYMPENELVSMLL